VHAEDGEPRPLSGPDPAGMEPEEPRLRSHALELDVHAELVVRTRVPAAVHALPVTLHEHDLAELAELVALRGGGASPPLVARVDEPLPRAAHLRPLRRIYVARDGAELVRRPL